MEKTPQKIKVAGVLYERIPDRIRVSGKVFKLAAPIPHKTCAKGTHWNVSQKKCLKLTPEQIRAIAKARKSSKIAHRTMKTTGSHRKAAIKHNKARLHNKAASNLLHAHGFHKLAKKYSNKARKHSSLRASHSSYGN